MIGRIVSDPHESCMAQRDRVWCALAIPATALVARCYGQSFTAELILPEVIADIGEPTDRRSFGAVIRSLARDGVIQKIGYAPAVTSHRSPKPLWEACP